MATISVEQTVKSIIVSLVSVDPEHVVPQAHIQDDLGADSLTVMEMIMRLEEEFGIEIPDEDSTGLRTVGDVIRWIEDHLA